MKFIQLSVLLSLLAYILSRKVKTKTNLSAEKKKRVKSQDNYKVYIFSKSGEYADSGDYTTGSFNYNDLKNNQANPSGDWKRGLVLTMVDNKQPMGSNSPSCFTQSNDKWVLEYRFYLLRFQQSQLLRTIGWLLPVIMD